jgi:ribosomal protein S27AE
MSKQSGTAAEIKWLADQNRKARASAPPSRKCLHCGKNFEPEHKGNWICGPCKKLGPFQGGVMG